MRLQANLTLSLFSFLLLGMSSVVLAETFTIPSIEASVSEDYIVESIAKLDDFTEEIQTKEDLRQGETIGFTSAALIHLGTITGTLIDQLLYKTKFLTPLFSNIDDASKIGKVSTLPARLGQFARNWMFPVAAVQSTKKSPEKVFEVHASDLPVFKNILNHVRQKQVSIFLKMIKNDPTKKSRIQNLEMTILEQRPSYKKVYGECHSDPNSYKLNTLIRIYRSSLFDYLKLLTFSPSALSSQYHSGFRSPTLKSYMNSFTLPFALKKCFKVSANASGIMADESDRFIAQLLAVDGVSKFVTMSLLATVWKFKNSPRDAGSSALAKLQASKLGEFLKPAIDRFLKISPATMGKVIAATQVTASAFALYSIREEYKESEKQALIERRSANDFLASTKKLFYERALLQMQTLSLTMERRDLDASDKEMLESELKNWQLIASEFSS